MSVDVKSYNINTNSPIVQKRLNSGENFGALDTKKIQQDTAEFAKKQTEEIKKENFVFRILRNLGVDNPKKFFISLGLTIATTVGLAFIGNKMSGKTANWGIEVDKFLKDKKWFQNLSTGFSNKKQSLINTLKKSKTFDDIYTTFKTKFAKPKADMTRGYGRGFVSIFSLTPVDVLKKTFKGKDAETIAKSLEGLVGSEKAKEFASQILGEIKDNREFCKLFSAAIRDNFGCKSNADFLKVLENLKKGIGKNGAKLDEFTNVIMKEKGSGIIGRLQNIFVGNWVPGIKGNLGDSLIKFNAVNGSLADTTLGKLVQKSIIVPTESVSNFVNDKSRLGLMLCASTMGTFNNMQDAPKEQKVATVADDFVGTVGSIAIATPLAFKTTYGLASLANLEGKGIIAKMLKPIGKFFHMGLSAKNPLLRLGGGALRFGLVMFVFSSMFRKPIEKVIHKIFGKPYNAAEEQAKLEKEKAEKQIIPELGVTQKELNDKLTANPQALQKLQNDPMLQREVAANPKLLLDLLDGKNVQTKPKDKLLSPANKKFVNEYSKRRSDVNAKKSYGSSSVDTARYIPSYEYKVGNSMDNEQISAINAALLNADKAIKRAEKYL